MANTNSFFGMNILSVFLSENKSPVDLSMDLKFLTRHLLILMKLQLKHLWNIL